jgi:hypothetical protein
MTDLSDTFAELDVDHEGAETLTGFISKMEDGDVLQLADELEQLVAHPAWARLGELLRVHQRRIKAGATSPTWNRLLIGKPITDLARGSGHAGHRASAARPTSSSSSAASTWRTRSCCSSRMRTADGHHEEPDSSEDRQPEVLLDGGRARSPVRRDDGASATADTTLTSRTAATSARSRSSTCRARASRCAWSAVARPTR